MGWLGSETAWHPETFFFCSWVPPHTHPGADSGNKIGQPLLSELSASVCPWALQFGCRLTLFSPFVSPSNAHVCAAWTCAQADASHPVGPGCHAFLAATSACCCCPRPLRPGNLDPGGRRVRCHPLVKSAGRSSTQRRGRWEPRRPEGPARLHGRPGDSCRGARRAKRVGTAHGAAAAVQGHDG